MPEYINQIVFNAPVNALNSNFGCSEKTNLQIFHEAISEVEDLITEDKEHLLGHLARVRSHCDREEILSEILSTVSLKTSSSTLPEGVKFVVLTSFIAFCIRCIEEEHSIELPQVIKNGIELLGKARKLCSSATSRPVQMNTLCSQLKRWLRLNPDLKSGRYYLSNIDNPNCQKCDLNRIEFESELSTIFSNIFGDFIQGNSQQVNSFFELEQNIGFSLTCGECLSNISLFDKSRGKI